MKKLSIVLAAALALTALNAQAGAPEPDAVVEAQLKSKGIKYEIDQDGDFKVVYEVGDAGRTQLAYVRTHVDEYGELRIREILSLGYRSEGNSFPPLVANRMLDHNNEVKLGAWATQDNLAVFTVKISADATADELVDALEFAVNAADKLEEEFTGSKDEF